MEAAAAVEQPEDLERRFAAGDLDAFETLFRRHQAEVFGWVVRIVRDAALAEDATIETFWRIYRARASFDARREFGPWARRIATNVAIDFLKAKPREVAGLDVTRVPGETTSRREPGAHRRRIEHGDCRRTGHFCRGSEIARPPGRRTVAKKPEEIADYAMKPTENELREMLKEALPVQPDDAVDLWPRMLRRLDERSTRIGWADRVLLLLISLGLILFPAIIPQLLYQL
ncbi:MAG: sigma-70 family RNA polymerase sigma factor [Bryobacteraceae bacterium]